MKNNGKLLGLLSGLFWGLDTVTIGIFLASVTLIALGNNASLVTTFLHDTVSFLSLFILLIFRKQVKPFFKILFSKAGLAIIAAALLGGPIGMSAYILSINYLGASLSSSISAIYPALGMILAYLFLKEKIKIHNILGVIISIIAIILMGFSSVQSNDNVMFGIVLVLICAVSWGSEAVIIKAALKEDVSAEIALSIRQMVTMLTYGLVIIPIVGYHNITPLLLDSKIIMLVVAAGLLGTVSYMYYYSAIDLLGATQSMALNITYPAWAFVFQFFIDGQFDPYLFFLSLVIIAGAILSNDNPKEFLRIFKKDK